MPYFMVKDSWLSENPRKVCKFSSLNVLPYTVFSVPDQIWSYTQIHLKDTYVCNSASS